jgi:hypothetical protein
MNLGEKGKFKNPQQNQRIHALEKHWVLLNSYLKIVTIDMTKKKWVSMSQDSSSRP